MSVAFAASDSMRFVQNFRFNSSGSLLNDPDASINPSSSGICEILTAKQFNGTAKIHELQSNEIHQICQIQSVQEIEDFVKLNCLMAHKFGQPTENNWHKMQPELQTICMKYKNNTQNSTNVSYLKNVLEYFHFYDFLVTYLNGFGNNENVTIDSQRNFDFIVLDVMVKKRQTNNDSSAAIRPFLILEGNHIDESYISHPVHPGYWDWESVLDVDLLTQCGPLCWLIIGVSIIFLLIVIAASIAVGIGIR